MTGSGQKTAQDLFELNLGGALAALQKGQMPNTVFQGALAELFVTHEMGWQSVSGPETDKYDALFGKVLIEIKSSANGRKPSASGKEYHEFCWLRVRLCGRQIWADSLTVEPKGHAHVNNKLRGKRRCIFDAEIHSKVNVWLSLIGIYMRT